MDLQLTDRVFVVTGGARGLGRAGADALVAEGARVVMSGRTPDSLEEAVATLNASSGREAAVAVLADNADREAPARLLAAARDTWGRVDGALISVGGPPKGAVTDITDEQWSAAFESVFLGAVRLARELGTALPEGGSLGLVLSSSVRAPLPQMAIQRTAARSCDGRQDARRGAGSTRGPRQRSAARPDRHRSGRGARRVHR